MATSPFPVMRWCGLDEERTALVIMFLSAILFSMMGVFVKLAADTGLSAFELVFIRAVGQGFFVLAGLFYFRVQKWFGEGDMRFWVIVRGILGGFGFCSYFTTIALLPIGDAIALASLYPIVTCIVARIALKEALSCVKVLAILLSTAGAFLVAQPSFLFGAKADSAADKAHPYAWVGYITAISGSIIGGCLFVIMRKARSAHLFQLLWSWVCGSIVVSLILANTLYTMSMPSTLGWLYVLGMCGFGTLGHFMMNYAGRMAPAGPSALLRSSDVLFAYLWEFFVFGQTANLVTIGGVVMIVVGIIVIAYAKARDGRKRGREATFTAIQSGEVDEETGGGGESKNEADQGPSTTLVDSINASEMELVTLPHTTDSSVDAAQENEEAGNGLGEEGERNENPQFEDDDDEEEEEDENDHHQLHHTPSLAALEGVASVVRSSA
uniref:EamA domain-containing protein n=1 Tax=Lotharella oceanica TaxID=641309 RepID=A0A7S2THL7_9EUKA|mmetsp:Transcript_14627/g.27759  ORF Transcript_14627/g.27759 Transcript_14627/m.27759 type:complete len:439 (+) Transcript_14627:45-1361(+)